MQDYMSFCGFVEVAKFISLAWDFVFRRCCLIWRVCFVLEWCFIFSLRKCSLVSSVFFRSDQILESLALEESWRGNIQGDIIKRCRSGLRNFKSHQLRLLAISISIR